MSKCIARWAYHHADLRLWRWLDLPEPCRAEDNYWFSRLNHAAANVRGYCPQRGWRHWLIGRWFEAPAAGGGAS